MTKQKFIVKPINSIEEAIKKGRYTWTYGWITDKTVPLKKLTKEKEVYVVSFDREVGETEYLDLLKAEGLKPAEPNYLLGLQAQYDKELPEKWIVSSSSVFTDSGGRRCFLCVFRDGADRKLGLASVGREWGAFWAFLAESLDPVELKPFLSLGHFCPHCKKKIKIEIK